MESKGPDSSPQPQPDWSGSAPETVDSGAATPPPGRRPREKWSVRKKVLVWGCTGLAGVIVACVVLIGVAWRHLNGNIKTENADLKPSVMQGKQDILFIGSDSRAGANQALGGGDVTGARSDTTMVFDSPADRREGTEVSIPRDSMVQIPACTSVGGDGNPAAGQTASPYFGMFNSAFSEGGAPCTAATIQSLTGLNLTHYIVVDFQGVVGVVNALGGVKVCVTQPIDDADSGLNIPAGTTNLNGDQALAFVRLRHSIGNGSDLERIQRQQYFLDQLEQQVRAAGLLTDPIKLYNVLDAATQSITTDPGLGSVKGLYSLAETLNEIPNGKISYVTVPNEPYPADPNRVQWTEPDAANLWNSLIQEPDSASPSATAPAGALGRAASGAPASAADQSLQKLEDLMELAMMADSPTDPSTADAAPSAGATAPAGVGTCPVS